MSCARTSVGVALTEEDMRFCTELISKIVAEEMEKILSAFEQAKEAISNAFDAGSRGCAEAWKVIQAAFDEIKVENAGISPKRYGMPLRKRQCSCIPCYQYIPLAPRNRPYQRRAY